MPVTVSVVGAAGRRRSAQLVAEPHAEVARQLLADQHVGGGQAVAAGDDLVGQRHDAEVLLGLDAGQRDRAAGVAAHHERRAADGRRRPPAMSLRIAHLVAHLLPLVDRLQPLQRRLHDGERRPGPAAGARSARATSFGRSSTMCGCELSTRRMKLACMPGQQRRHEDDHRHADRHADDDEQRLQAPFAQEADGGDPFERQPAFTARRRRAVGAARRALGCRRASRGGGRPAATRSPGCKPCEDLGVAGAAQRRASPAGAAARRPTTFSTHGAPLALSCTASVGTSSAFGPPRHFDVDRHRHVLAQVGRRLRHANFTSTEPRCASTAGIDVDQLGAQSAGPDRRRPTRAPAGPSASSADVLLVDLHHQLGVARPATAPSAPCPAAPRRRARRRARSARRRPARAMVV